MVRVANSEIAKEIGNRSFPVVETEFVAPEIILRDDVAERKMRLSRIVSNEIVPRLARLHRDFLRDTDIASPSEDEIVELAHLVLSPDLQSAAAYVTALRERGLLMETLFIELLQPAAQYLGTMWDNDECDFVDVTLGVGQLQKLLAVFNCTIDLPAVGEKRRVLLLHTPGEQHSFGLAMVEKLHRAAGWDVTLATDLSVESVSEAVAKDWYAVAGISLSNQRHLNELICCVSSIRQKSRNPAIGIMVGGPHFIKYPELAHDIGADATASSATTAVLLTQKLFDIGVGRN